MKKNYYQRWLALTAAAFLCAAWTLSCGAQETEALSEAEENALAYLIDEEEEEDAVVSRQTGSTVFSEIEAVNDDYLVAAFSSEDEDPSDGYSCTAHLENRTDQNLMVYFENASINDTMCATDYWGSQSWILQPGEQSDQEIIWTTESLQQSRIEKLERITFTVTAQTEKDVEDGLITSQKTCEIDFETPLEIPDVTAPEDEKPQAIFADDEYTFEILSYGSDSQGQPVWNVYFENNSDKTVMIELSDVLVNGFAVDSYWNTVVSAGKKAYPAISMWSIDMSANEISDITKVEFRLQIWKAEPGILNFYTDPSDISCVVYPKGKDQSTQQDRTVGKDELLLWEDENFLASVTAINNTGESGYYGLDFYLENNTSEKVRFVADSVYYDDFETHPYWSVTLPAHSKKNASLLTDTGAVSPADLQDIELIVLSAGFYNASSKVLMEETFAIDCAAGALTEIPEEETETETEELTGEEIVPEETEAETVPEETEEAEVLTEEQTAAPETEIETEPETMAEPETVTEPETAAAPETEPETASVTEPETETEAKTEAVTETETEAVTEAETEVVTEAETETVTEASTEAETEPYQDPNRVNTVYEDEMNIRNVQSALDAAGYPCLDENGRSDGKMGSVTIGAIRSYREDHHLEVLDRIDDDLLESLGIVNADTYKQVQAALNELGFDCGSADGRFGAKTGEAIAAYCRSVGLPEKAQVDDELLASLNLITEEEAKIEAPAETEAEPETETEAPAETKAEPETETEAPAETEAEPETEIETEAAVSADAYTDEDTVKNVQSTLTSLGYDCGYEGKADGLFGDATANAIGKYRQEHEMSDGNTITDELLEALGIADAATYKKVQEALNEAGFDCGEPDGLIGKKTTQAIEDYREKEGLAPGTQIDAQLLESLGIR